MFSGDVKEISRSVKKERNLLTLLLLFCLTNLSFWRSLQVSPDPQMVSKRRNFGIADFYRPVALHHVILPTVKSTPSFLYRPFSRWTWVNRYQCLHSGGSGGGGDSWGYKVYKAAVELSPPTKDKK